MRSAVFARALALPTRHRSRHFALHHIAGEPSCAELSTGGAPNSDASVDDSRLSIGVLVPKRHARRAVTRSLLKRQARAALSHVATQLADGFWLVRLRAPFDKARFPSAASSELRSEARLELDRLVASAVRRA